jgi:hypothetical protein
MGYDEEYEELLASAKSSPDTVDFQELRLACTRSSRYSPYTAASEGQCASGDVLGGIDGEAALDAALRTLGSNYLEIEAHLLAASEYRATGDQAKAKYHESCARGLLDSVLRSGDGRTPGTAFAVISVAEEYAVRAALAL